MLPIRLQSEDRNSVVMGIAAEHAVVSDIRLLGRLNSRSENVMGLPATKIHAGQNTMGMEMGIGDRHLSFAMALSGWESQLEL